MLCTWSAVKVLLLGFHLYFLDQKHDDVIKWKHFQRYWPFVRGIHRSPVNFPHKGQWRGALMFSLICTSTDDWAYNRDAGDLSHRTHYDVTVMKDFVVLALYAAFFVCFYYCDMTRILETKNTHIIKSYCQWGKPGELGVKLPAWWRHQMETISASLALCAGNSPVTGEFLSQRPVTRSFGVFFDPRPNKRLSKQWWAWWFMTLLLIMTS